MVSLFIFIVQPIDLPMEHMSLRFWKTKQSNGCSTPALGI